MGEPLSVLLMGGSGGKRPLVHGRRSLFLDRESKMSLPGFLGRRALMPSRVERLAWGLDQSLRVKEPMLEDENFSCGKVASA